jgi:hypothetical protein
MLISLKIHDHSKQGTRVSENRVQSMEQPSLILIRLTPGLRIPLCGINAFREWDTAQDWQRRERPAVLCPGASELRNVTLPCAEGPQIGHSLIPV